MACKECIYNIPCCGGWCAPTENPDSSCLRHVSNEYTLPAARAYMKIAPVFELSACCRSCGRIGMQRGATQRKPLMLFAFSLSLFGFLAAVFAALGISRSAGPLKKAAWVFGDIKHPSGAVVHVAIGLNGHADTVDCSTASSHAGCAAYVLNSSRFEVTADQLVFERFTAWDDDDGCPAQGHGLDMFTPEQCAQCRDSAMSTATFALTGVISAIPQMMTDLQRATTFGDTNCQATMGRATSIFGFLSGLMSLRSFLSGCWKNLPSNYRLLQQEEFGWRLGPALVCLGLATMLKAPDAIMHCLLPSSKANLDASPADLALPEYLKLGVSENEVKVAGREVAAATVGKPETP